MKGATIERKACEHFNLHKVMLVIWSIQNNTRSIENEQDGIVLEQYRIYNTVINTTKYILHVYKLNYNEDWQEEHVYRITQIYKP